MDRIPLINHPRDSLADPVKLSAYCCLSALALTQVVIASVGVVGEISTDAAHGTITALALAILTCSVIGATRPEPQEYMLIPASLMFPNFIIGLVGVCTIFTDPQHMKDDFSAGTLGIYGFVSVMMCCAMLFCREKARTP